MFFIVAVSFSPALLLLYTARVCFYINDCHFIFLISSIFCRLYLRCCPCPSGLMTTQYYYLWNSCLAKPTAFSSVIQTPIVRIERLKRFSSKYCSIFHVAYSSPQIRQTNSLCHLNGVITIKSNLIEIQKCVWYWSHNPRTFFMLVLFSFLGICWMNYDKLLINTK